MSDKDDQVKPDEQLPEAESTDKAPESNEEPDVEGHFRKHGQAPFKSKGRRF
jgi:hypothetical protein